MADLKKLLAQVGFGSQVAEDEARELGQYFVETAQWSRIEFGEKDIVYGSKGAGKSALYAVLLERKDEFAKRGIVISRAEQARGEPLFAEIVTDPPQSEDEWRVLWRAYFIGIVADVLASYAIETDSAKAVFQGLEQNKLRRGKGLRALLQSAREFARRIASAKTVEASAGADPAGVKVAAKFELPDGQDQVEAALAVASLLESADQALAEADLEVWVALDRLDASFSDPTIETPAIRALMRVYRDLANFEQITPKIFLRQDIWAGITEGEVFREGSHIVRDETIVWNRDTLLNLAVRRIVRNPELCRHFGVEAETVLESVDRQEALFERLFEKGDEDERVLDWALEALQDGQGRTSPRELIHLLSALRDKQIERLQVGRPDPAGDALFDREVRELALEEVARAHLEKTIYSETRKIKDFVERLKGGPIRYSEEDLNRIWGDQVDSVEALIGTLLRAGFLRRLPAIEGGFEIAMLYRPALELSSELRDDGESDGT